jgi:hypothetical protein
MSKVVSVLTNDDYTLLIEFEGGNKILFNMQKLVNTLPYLSLKNLECFRSIKIEDQTLCWEDPDLRPTMMPVRLTVDNILFTIRD